MCQRFCTLSRSFTQIRVEIRKRDCILEPIFIFIFKLYLIDYHFLLLSFSFLTGIIIPGAWSKETALLLLIAASLVARSASDIWMIQSVTIIESTIIQMDRRKFLNTLFKYCAALPLVSYSCKECYCFGHCNHLKTEFLFRFQW